MPTSPPTYDFIALTQLALRALQLVAADDALVAPRLPAGLLDELRSDLERLGSDVPSAKVARTVSRAATASQDRALANAHRLVSAIRGAVRLGRAPDAIQRGYGVGSRVVPQSVKSVVAAARVILDRAAANPDELPAYGVVPSDLATLSADAAALSAADAAQEQARASAPLSTKARNETVRRIATAIARIHAVGVLVFAKSDAKRAEFESLVLPSKRSSKKSANRGGGAASGGT